MKERSKSGSEGCRIFVSDKLGSVSAIWSHIMEPAAIVTVAHSAGSDMNQPFLEQLCEAFAGHNIATLRFNFPYRENGKKMPDRFPAASETIHAVLDEAATRYPDVPVFCSGKSFGGRMSSMTLAARSRVEVKGLIFYGFPLHPPDQPSIQRAEHLEKSGLPMLFFQGTKDKLAFTDLISDVCSRLVNTTLIILDGVDHSMTNRKQSGVDYLVQRSAHWINQVITPGIGDAGGQSDMA